MAARGQTVTAIASIDANGDVENVVKDKPGMTLMRRSAVQIFLTREAVGVLATVTIGGSIVMPQGPTNIDSIVGTLPSTQDDLLIEVIAQKADEIIIAGTNTTGAALELRALVKIMPV